MGIFKQMKDMKATVAAAPGMIDQANQLAEQGRQLAQMNAALSAPPGDAIGASARVLSAGESTGRFNNDPIVPVELMIFQPGGAPRPVSTSVVVPLTQMHRLATGATVPVKLSASNPDALAIDWSAPA